MKDMTREESSATKVLGADEGHSVTLALDLASAFEAVRVRASAGSPGDAAWELAQILWLAGVAQLRPGWVFRGRWCSSRGLAWLDRLADDVRVLHRVVQDDGDEDYVFIRGNVLVRANSFRGCIEVYAASRSEDEGRSALEWMRTQLPVPTAPGGFRVPVTLWSSGRHGPQPHTEILDVHDWSGAARNYSAATREALDAYVRDVEVGSGKLALWLGPPGTGKTHALRALAWEQRATVRIHYVLDPEVFLEQVAYEVAVFGHEEDEEDGKRRLRLIVLEDAGEFLGADAKSRVGQGLSRLLNLTDGLPGQGMRTRVLITSNEDVGNLHPAVTRPGRCGTLVRFALLDATEAAEWMNANGRRDLGAGDAGALSVADLYARLRGESRVRPSHIGFAART